MSLTVSLTATEAESAKALQARLLLQDVFLWRCEADGAGPPVMPAEPVTVEADFEWAYEGSKDSTEDFSITVKVASYEKLTFHVTATFLVRYNLLVEPSPRPEEGEAFAKSQGLLAAWPYLRELVQNTTARMGLPIESLPALRLVLQTTRKTQTLRKKKRARRTS